MPYLPVHQLLRRCVHRSSFVIPFLKAKNCEPSYKSMALGNFEQGSFAFYSQLQKRERMRQAYPFPKALYQRATSSSVRRKAADLGRSFNSGRPMIYMTSASSPAICRAFSGRAVQKAPVL